MRKFFAGLMIVVSGTVFAAPGIDEGPVLFLGYNSPVFDEVQRLWFRDALIRKSRAGGKNVPGPMTVASVVNRYALDEGPVPDNSMFASIAGEYGAALVAAGGIFFKEGKLVLTIRAYKSVTRSVHEVAVTLDNSANPEVIEKRITDSCYEKLFSDRGWLEK